MKHVHDLRGLLIEQLKEQNSGERQQLVCFPQLRERTSSRELQHIIDQHIGKTRKQLMRIERIFRLLDRNIHGEFNLGVKGLVEEALELAARCTNEDVLDAGIITSIQHLNHHNIASYGALREYADELGETEVSGLLSASLEEERRTNKELSRIASERINLRAIHP